MSEATQTATRTSMPKAWSLWERPKTPPAYRMQPRDILILEAVFRHRFLTVSHIYALLGGSESKLSVRCRFLWQDGYLERPKALRPTKILTEEIVYGLGKKGAQLLDELRKKGQPILQYLKPTADIGQLDWAESPKKQIGWPYIDHQLGIASFMIAMQRAAESKGMRFQWDGHFNRQQHRITVYDEDDKKVSFLPDAHFVLEDSTRGTAHHYLEIDRGNVSLKRMKERYERYLQFWKSDQAARSRGFKKFRVLTVTYDQDYMHSLRRAAHPIGRDHSHPNTWKGLMFTHAGKIDLQQPERMLETIWLYADDDAPVSLI
jgi:hypothetical protein